ncbi:SdrD B-like domain-containing protein, partial [Variovorax sp. PCZ-1]|uniref:SdrD B-like domain-containing protein n=1 Tax=Variovorax sp. PCZ-1 TaxID=2835533 RepID=UPI001BCCEF09
GNAGSATVTTIQVFVPGTATGSTITGTATVATSTPETTLSNNTATDTMPVGAVDIVTTLAFPTATLAGTTATGTVTFTNSSNTTVSFTISYPVNGVTTTETVTVGPNGSVTRTVSVPVGTTPVVVTAGASGSSITESNLTNNTQTATVTPLIPDVSITFDLPASAQPNTTVSATVTVANLGQGTASNVVTTVTLSTGQVVTVSLGTLSPTGNAGSATVTTIQVFVPGTATGSTITGTATVATSTPETTLSNNRAVDIVGSLSADVSVSLVLSANSAPIGSTVTGTATFVNLGGASLTFTPTYIVGTTTVTGAPITIAAGASATQAVPTSITVGTSGVTVTAGVGATNILETTTTNNTTTRAVTPLAPNSSVSGRVWLDVNSDRIYSLGTDQDLAGWRVELLNSSGVIVGTATTGITGSYTITGQVPSSIAGTYTIRFRNPSGEVIVTTPLNQATTTFSGNASTGTTTSAVNGTRTIGGSIGNITLYAGDNTVEQNLPIDPSGVVYDAVTRLPVAGAQVTLLGPNGSPVPGACLVQGAATQTTNATGIYRFDLVGVNPPPAGCTPQTGVYTLQIIPPSGYVAPPAAAGGVSAPGVAVGVAGNIFTPPNQPGVEVLMQPNTTAPAVGVNGAAAVGAVGTQYFLSFNINPALSSGVIHNHIPLDPLASGALLVSKVGDKSVAEVGDSVKYTIRIRNTTPGGIAGVQLEDLLPAGFRYILGTARLNAAVLADPAGGIGRALTFNIGSAGAIPANTTWELTYFVRLGVGSQQGDGINRATAVFQGVNGAVRSNTAQYRVRVQGGVFSNDGCIIGKVYVDCDGNHVQNNESGSRELGIPGVRLIMLDGTQITTDSEGKYSICGVKAQTHVIKVDRTTMPKGSRLMPSSNRNAGVGDSIFVDLKGGEMARADFIEGSCSPEVLDQVKARRAQGNILAPEKETPPDLKIDNRPLQIEQQILPSLRPESPAPGNAGGKAP